MQWPSFLRVYDESGKAVRLRLRYLLFILAAFGFIAFSAVYLPIAMTSTPSFCDNCHLMAEPVALWEESTHSNVNCIKCHIDPGFINTVKHKVMSYKEIYGQFFGSGEMPEDVHLPNNAACLECHGIERDVSPGGDIKIPHAEHVEMRDIKCADCHFNVVHTRRAVSGGPPPMDVCYMCHDGERAPDECETCHTTPRDEYEREGHNPSDLLETHGELARDRIEDCRRCHTESSNFCENCHSQPPQTHQRDDWRFTHRQEVEAKGRDTCFGCHEENFCEKCHKVQHPPNWEQTHSEFAQGGGEACEVCHAPAFCQNCHQAEGVTVTLQ